MFSRALARAEEKAGEIAESWITILFFVCAIIYLIVKGTAVFPIVRIFTMERHNCTRRRLEIRLMKDSTNRRVYAIPDTG